MLVGPRAAMTAETEATKVEEGAPACQKKVSNTGRLHRMNTVATLSGIRAWSQRAMKYGEEYTMWHNAKSQTIKCDKLARSDYFVCFVSGKPCRTSNDGKTASNKTN
jgi:hypothetical protein